MLNTASYKIHRSGYFSNTSRFDKKKRKNYNPTRLKSAWEGEKNNYMAPHFVEIKGKTSIDIGYPHLPDIENPTQAEMTRKEAQFYANTIIQSPPQGWIRFAL